MSQAAFSTQNNDDEIDHENLEFVPTIVPPPVIPEPPRAPAVDYSKVIAVITAWQGILNARLLALLSLIGALFIFGYAMYDPTNLRLTAASLYATGVLWPIMWLYLRKG